MIRDTLVEHETIYSCLPGSIQFLQEPDEWIKWRYDSMIGITTLASFRSEASKLYKGLDNISGCAGQVVSVPTKVLPIGMFYFSWNFKCQKKMLGHLWPRPASATDYGRVGVLPGTTIPHFAPLSAHGMWDGSNVGKPWRPVLLTTSMFK